MASGGSSGQSGFRLGRSKKNPGVLDQIGKFFGGDKKRKGKGSFRGALSASPQRATHSSPRRKGDQSAVAHFFRSIVSTLFLSVSFPPVSLSLSLSLSVSLPEPCKMTSSRPQMCMCRHKRLETDSMRMV
uniref:Myelin basic protein n=1 Tax=Pygocentrus nattereri TaxID=42514 RepID=A0AAR2KAX5_PYGNA